jgi:hypothetical protein
MGRSPVPTARYAGSLGARHGGAYCQDGAVQLTPLVAQAYMDRAFDQMVDVVGRVADDDLNTKPFGEGTNSIAVLVTHSTEVCHWWLGHVGLGEPTERDRDAEFVHVADRAELEDRIARARDAVAGHIRRLDGGEGRPHPDRAHLHGDGSDGSIVLHVLEELYQHLGHMDITADALAARRPAG